MTSFFDQVYRYLLFAIELVCLMFLLLFQVLGFTKLKKNFDCQFISTMQESIFTSSEVLKLFDQNRIYLLYFEKI